MHINSGNMILLTAEYDNKKDKFRYCPVCRELYESQCKCASFIHPYHPYPIAIDLLKEGHGLSCKNGHRWQGDAVYDPSNTVQKTAQNLETVKTPEKFTDRELTRATRDAIIAEEGAIKQYEAIVDATDNKDAKEILTEIANEERIHIGELQTLLNKLLPDEQKHLDEGKKEVENK